MTYSPRKSGLLTSAAHQDRPVQAKGVVHKLVAQTAKDFARVIYEEAAHDNDFYKKWPTMDDFVARRWQSFIQPARENLASLLHPSRHSMTTPAMREEIHQALLLNAATNPAINSPLN